MFLNKNHVNFLRECGFINNGNNCLCLKFKIILLEQNDNYLDYIRNGGESNIERILKS